MLVSSGQTEVLEQLKGECSALGTVPWRAGTQYSGSRWLTFTRDAPPFSSSD